MVNSVDDCYVRDYLFNELKSEHLDLVLYLEGHNTANILCLGIKFAESNFSLQVNFLYKMDGFLWMIEVMQ